MNEQQMSDLNYLEKQLKLKRKIKGREKALRILLSIVVCIITNAVITALKMIGVALGGIPTIVLNIPFFLTLRWALKISYEELASQALQGLESH